MSSSTSIPDTATSRDELVRCSVVSAEQSTADLGKLQAVVLGFKQQNSILLSHVMPQKSTDTAGTDMLAHQVSYSAECDICLPSCRKSL